MKRMMVLAFSVILATPAFAQQQKQQPGQQETITVRFAPVRVGDRRTISARFQLVLGVVITRTTAGETQESRADDSSVDVLTVTEEVLAVQGRKKSKLKVTYGEYKSGDAQQPENTHLSSPVAGKSYIVSTEAQGLVITTADGQSVPDEEYKIVAGHYSDPGEGSPLLVFLKGKSFTTGVSVELPENVRDFLLEEQNIDSAQTSITLEKTNDRVMGADCFVFTLSSQGELFDRSGVRTVTGTVSVIGTLSIGKQDGLVRQLVTTKTLRMATVDKSSDTETATQDIALSRTSTFRVRVP